MSDRVRGFERRALELDFNLYRLRLPIDGLPGACLSVIDMRPEGVEQTILLQHGYAGCAETWEYQITALSAHYRVVAPDLRGHGQSDAPYSRYNMDELTGDLERITRQLDLPERFVLAGHSFGGAVALEYADRHPERVERLVLVATPGEFPLPRSVGLLSRIPTPVYRLFWRYRPRWNAEPHVLKRMLLDNMRGWQGWSILSRLALPTLIVTGARDTYFPPASYARVAAALPEAELVDVGASKHKVQLERHQAVTRAIERFVQGGPARSWRDEPISARLARRRPWLAQYEAGSPPTVPLPHQPLHAFLTSTARRLPRRTATRWAGRRQSYAQLERRANQLAHALIGLGLAPGDRVGLRLSNLPEMPVAFFGILKAGGAVLLPELDASEAALEARLRSTGTGMLVAGADDLVAARAARAARLEHLILVGDAELDGAEGPETRGATRLWQLDAILVDVEEADPGLEIHPEALAAIACTSGHSGPPKAVCLSHQNLVANAIQIRHWLPDLGYGRDRFLSGLSLGQAYGLTLGLSLPVLLGASMILCPELEASRLLALCRRERPSVLLGNPALFGALIDHPAVSAARLDRSRLCLSGGAPLPIELHESFERLTGARLLEGYGLTEAGPVSHANPASDRRRAGCIGLPLPNTDARIVDLEGGADLPPGAAGLLLLRGPQISPGYWRAEGGPCPWPESGEGEIETTHLAGGWLHTGDLAVMDAGGFFRLLGRADERILGPSGPVYPRDVTEVLFERSSVRDAAVFASADPAGSQAVLALVAGRPGQAPDPLLLAAHCLRRLPEAERPKEIRVLDRLPRDAAGKIGLQALRAAWKQAAPRPLDEPR